MSTVAADPRVASSPHPVESGPRVVLVVDATELIGRELLAQLRADGYHAAHARSAAHARALAGGHQIRAVVLGALEPSRAALDLLGEIRRPPAGVVAWDEDLPVIVLGPRAEQLDLLRAFEAGADDFMAHPPSYLELRARLRSVLRRAERVEPARLLRVGALLLDTRAHTVTIAGRSVRLSPLEYELLVHLARRPADVVSKHELLRAIWGAGSRVDPRTVDRHASRLRGKLNAAGAVGMVVTVWGVGYRLT